MGASTTIHRCRHHFPTEDGSVLAKARQSPQTETVTWHVSPGLAVGGGLPKTRRAPERQTRRYRQLALGDR